MTNDAGEWLPVGQLQQIRPDEIRGVPDFDPSTGDHLWLWVLFFRATPGVAEPLLDRETLLSVTGPGCAYCEQPWTRGLAARRCAGRPS